MIYAHCPALLIGLLGWASGTTVFLCCPAPAMGVQRDGRTQQQAAWAGSAEHTVGPYSASGKWCEAL